MGEGGFGEGCEGVGIKGVGVGESWWDGHWGSCGVVCGEGVVVGPGGTKF